MNDNNRRYFSPEQKVAILREHLLEAKAVSDLWDKHHIHPTVFYQWQRQFFENGTAAFDASGPAPEFLMGMRRSWKVWSKNSNAKTRCSPSS
jgi:transposase-like protein